MIDPQLRPFLDTWDKAWAPMGPNATPQARRQHFLTVADAMKLPLPDGIAVREHRVPFEGRTVRVVSYRHRDASAETDALIYMHGGGWTQGSPETHADITARIAADNHQVVFSVDYALAPELTFPIAVNECQAVVRWALAQAGELRISPRRLAIGGDSAGGNLAAAVCLALRGTPARLTGQLLVYPAVDFIGNHYPSLAENADGPIIKAANRDAAPTLYCPNAADLRNPLASPLLADSHRDLPPAYVAVAEHDPLRDEGRAYGKALVDAGVPVVVDPGTSLFHGYLRGMGYSPLPRARLAAMCAWLRSLPDS